MLVQPLAQAAPAPAKAAAVGATDPSVAGSSVQGLGGVLPNFVASGDGVIRLQVGAFDPLADPLPQANDIPLIDENLLAAAPTSAAAQYWIVQVRDHRYAEVGAAVENAGASIANVVPDDAYLVRATAAQRAALAQSPAVRWSGYYQPAWRLPTAANGKPALTDLAGTQRYSVYAVRTDPDPSSIGATLAEIPGVTIVDDAGPVVDIEATAAELPFIASVAGVEWVSATPTYVAFNGNARWVLDTGERDVLAATRSNRLTGAGQTAAVADTAPNYRPDKRPTAHTAFRDCVGTNLNTCKEADFTQQTPGSTTAAMLAVAAHNTGHRKMAAFFDLGGAGPNPSDEAAHGTHVAGSVAGDAGPQGTAQDDDGMAPGARLVHQGIADTTGALTGIPTDYYQLFRQAYRPSNPGSVPTTSGTNGNVADYANYQSNQDARTHNNSYGAGVPVADAGGRTAALDQFVWDHEDMAIVVSASNSGPGAGTVTSPSTAKNNFSSGASSNGRQPMVSIGNMANFSSHGPTGDGRFGVTVATPGEIVVGPKGGTNDGYQYLQGTSMSGPILTGALTLVRQYFYDGYGPAGGKGFAVGSANANARRWNPSAALVKAAVVNGAVRMRGWYTGDDGTQRALDGQWPSAGQGFGLVNLDNSLYFANDPTYDWYTDVWRSDAAAFAVTDTGAARTYQIQVAAGQPLDVTLAYTDPASALAAGTETLVNNLDLQVIGPGGTYVGNNIDSRTNPSVAVATTPPGSANPDTVNNLERVHVAAPPAGLYTVRVIGTKVMQGRQGFGLAASGNISAPGTAFAAGPPRQADVAGNPTLASGRVTPGSNDVEKLTFSTNEPTTAKATLTVNGSPVTYSDVYNLGGNVNSPSTFPGMDTAPVETGPDYANKLMVGTTHEIFLTGLSRSTPYTASIEVTDLGGHKVTKTLQFTTLTNVFQPQARDQGQLAQSGDQWKIGKQFYAGIPDTTGDHWLGAFMYRLPESVDPSKITGAIVEVTTAHSLSNLYNVDPLFTMDLLNESVEPAWGTQSFATIHDAPATARALPDTTVRSGGGTTLDFTFACSDLAALKQTLSTVN
ncbi:MAG: hypothetical protein QOH79_155, partial [Acidimicrobiaceae bacterium]